MDQKIIALYDEYTHAPLDRRVFLERLTALAGSAVSAYALLPLLENNYAVAQTVPADDPDLITERVTFPGATGPVNAYLARPRAGGKHPGVIVIHENRGLNPHTEDVTRRAAKAGFVALGPDMLSPLGGTPSNEDQAREMISRLDAAQTVANLKSAVGWLGQQATTNGRVGAMGFCWGGGMVNQLAAADPALDAAVVFYGRSPDPAKVPDIRAPLLLHYAGLDDSINQTVPAYTTALDKAGKSYTLYRYEGANHAFLNDTNAARYNREAAELAWQRTVDFLKKQLT